jgi:hypothetical protein
MEIEENLPFLNGVSEHSNRKFEGRLQLDV